MANVYEQFLAPSETNQQPAVVPDNSVPIGPSGEALNLPPNTGADNQYGGIPAPVTNAPKNVYAQFLESEPPQAQQDKPSVSASNPYAKFVQSPSADTAIEPEQTGKAINLPAMPWYENLAKSTAAQTAASFIRQAEGFERAGAAPVTDLSRVNAPFQRAGTSEEVTSTFDKSISDQEALLSNLQSVADKKGFVSSDLKRQMDAAKQQIGNLQIQKQQTLERPEYSEQAQQELLQERQQMGQEATQLEQKAEGMFPYFGVNASDEAISAQIGRGLGTFAGLAPAMVTGPLALPIMATQGASQAYAEGYNEKEKELKKQGVTDQGEIDKEAHKAGSQAAVGSVPQLAAYMVGGALTTKATSALFKGSSPIVKGLVGGTAAAGVNLATSGGLRVAQGGSFAPTIEQSVPDILFGAIHGVGSFAQARAEAKAKIDASVGGPEPKVKPSANSTVNEREAQILAGADEQATVPEGVTTVEPTPATTDEAKSPATTPDLDTLITERLFHEEGSPEYEAIQQQIDALKPAEAPVAEAQPTTPNAVQVTSTEEAMLRPQVTGQGEVVELPRVGEQKPEVPAKEAEAPKEEVAPKYTPEVQAKLDELKNRVDEQRRMLKFYLDKKIIDNEGYQKRSKALGMTSAAEKRQITGELTAKEQAAKNKREASNYMGKPVSVDGRNGKVVGTTSFGRVPIRFEDGTELNVPREKIEAPIAQEPQPPVEAKPEEVKPEEVKSSLPEQTQNEFLDFAKKQGGLNKTQAQKALVEYEKAGNITIGETGEMLFTKLEHSTRESLRKAAGIEEAPTASKSQPIRDLLRRFQSGEEDSIDTLKGLADAVGDLARKTKNKRLAYLSSEMEEAVSLGAEIEDTQQLVDRSLGAMEDEANMIDSPKKGKQPTRQKRTKKDKAREVFGNAVESLSQVLESKILDPIQYKRMVKSGMIEGGGEYDFFYNHKFPKKVRELIFSKTGERIDVVSDNMGFKDPTELLTAIDDAYRSAERINEETKALEKQQADIEENLRKMAEMEKTDPEAHALAVEEEVRTHLRNQLRREGGYTELPQIIYDAAISVGRSVAKAARDFKSWSGEMVSRLGDGISNHLRKIWGSIKESWNKDIGGGFDTGGRSREQAQRDAENAFNYFEDPIKQKEIIANIEEIRKAYIGEDRKLDLEKAIELYRSSRKIIEERRDEAWSRKESPELQNARKQFYQVKSDMDKVRDEIDKTIPKEEFIRVPTQQELDRRKVLLPKYKVKIVEPSERISTNGILIYNTEGKLVGNADFKIKPESTINNKYTPKRLFINSTKVRPEYQGQKYGEVLYREIAKYAQKVGAKEIEGIPVSSAAAAVRYKLFPEREAEGYTPYKFVEQGEKGAEMISVIKPDISFIDEIPTSRLENWANDTIKESKKRLNVGLDPEVLTAYAVKGAYKIARGVRDFSAWTKEMLSEFGEGVRPHLQDIWNQAKQINSERINFAPKAPTEQEAFAKKAADAFLKGRGKPITEDEMASILARKFPGISPAEVSDLYATESGKPKPSTAYAGGAEDFTETPEQISIRRKDQADQVRQGILTSPVPAGEGTSRAEILDQGNANLSKGDDPFVALEKAKQGDFNALTTAKAYSQGLAKKVSDALKRFGPNSPEYKELAKQYQDYYEGIREAGTVASDILRTFQGQTDLSNAADIAREYTTITGEQPTLSQHEQIRKVADKVDRTIKESEKASNDHKTTMDKGLSEVEVQTPTSVEEGRQQVADLSDAQGKKAKDEIDRLNNELEQTKKDLEEAKQAKATGQDAESLKAYYEAKLKDLQGQLDKTPKYGKDVLDQAEKIVKRWELEAVEAEKELRKILSQQGTYPDPTAILPLAKIIKAWLGRRALTFAEASSEAIAKFGEKVRPHLKSAWEKAQELKSQDGGEKVAKTVRKATTKAKAKPINKMTPAEKAEESLRKRIAQTQKKIDDFNSGKITTPKEVEKVTSDEIKRLEDEYNQKKKELADARLKSKQKELFEKEKVGEDLNPEQVKTLWESAKRFYLDKGEGDYDKMIADIASDFGITPQQVRKAFGTPKGAKKASDEMYLKQRNRQMALDEAKRWLDNQKASWIGKVFGTAAEKTFKLAIFGHGTAFIGTHAPQVLYTNPKLAFKAWLKGLGYSFRGKDGRIKNIIDNKDLIYRPNWIVARRGGLENDPREIRREGATPARSDSTLAKALDTISGGRGFDALFHLRQDMFDQAWNQLSVTMRTPEMAEMLANSINNATGFTKGGRRTADILQSPITKILFFAPKLIASRFKWLIQDPARMLNTFGKMANPFIKVSPEERMSAVYEAKNKAKFLGVMTGTLLANQALLSVTGSNQSINFLDPKKHDWLAYKGFGYNLATIGAFTRIIRLVAQEYHAVFGELSRWEKAKGGREQVMKDALYTYLRSGLSPITRDIIVAATGKDYVGNTAPWSNEQPDRGRRKLTWREIIQEQFAPIPISEAATQKEVIPAAVKAGSAAFLGTRLETPADVEEYEKSLKSKAKPSGELGGIRGLRGFGKGL